MATEDLTSEAVEGASLSLEGVDHIEGSHSLARGVLSVGDGIADDILEEHLEDTAGLLVDEAADSLDTTSASKTANSGLGDTLDVIAKHLPVPLGAALTETLATLTTTGHITSFL